MKTDTQHLEFLISQYVDGSLDGPAKKLMEQQLGTDPAARLLLKQHTEVQEILEDWGSRIPLIDWNEFDQKLAAKLDAEVPAVQRVVFWRKGMGRIAAAAAVVFALGIGYAWHASSVQLPNDSNLPVAVAPPMNSVEIAQPVLGPSLASVKIEEAGALSRIGKGLSRSEGDLVRIDGGNNGDERLSPLSPLGPPVGSAHAEAPGLLNPNLPVSSQPGIDSLR